MQAIQRALADVEERANVETALDESVRNANASRNVAPLVFRNMDKEEALRDFLRRINHYEVHMLRILQLTM